MTENTLLPCPFCGGQAEQVVIEAENDPNFGGSVIACSGCGASSHIEFGFKEGLVSAWNARAELQERRKAEAPGYPETLPCPVFLEPGLKFGKGVSTRLVLDALRRRADYYAELEGMTPEQRAKHDAGIDEFKAMLQGSQPVSNRDELPCAQVKAVADLYALRWRSGEVVTYTPDSEKAAIWLNNYSDTCVQEYVKLERFQGVVSGNSPVQSAGDLSSHARGRPE